MSEDQMISVRTTSDALHLTLGDIVANGGVVRFIVPIQFIQDRIYLLATKFEVFYEDKV